MSGSLLRRNVFPPAEPGLEMRSILSRSTGTVSNTSSSTMQEALFHEHQREGMTAYRHHAQVTTPFESVQSSRKDDSQRSRLALGSRFLSPKALDTGSVAHQENRGPASLATGTVRSRSAAPQAPDSDFQLNSNLTADRLQLGTEPYKSRIFSQARSGKSLRQRLDPEQPQQPPAYCSVPSSGDHTRGSMHSHHDGQTSRPQSRSVSVLSSVRQDDDISTLMMRGATDLRNAKYDIEEQRREIAFLQEQVAASRKEKDELAERLKAVKDAAKRSLQSSFKSLEAFRTTVDELKAQSEVSLGIGNDVRDSLASVEELRNTVLETTKTIEPYLEPNEKWAKSTAMKELVNELELECSKSQQVADLLRDRLQSVGGELVEAKSRVTELEMAQAEDRSALCRANMAIVESTKETTSLVECSKRQQADLHDALVFSADLQAKLGAVTERAEELQQLVKDKDIALDALKSVQDENRRLLATIEEQNSCINSLRDAQKEVDQLRETLIQRDLTIAELSAFNSSKESRIQECTTRMSRLEDDASESSKCIQELKSDLRASEAREQAIARDNEKLLKEQEALLARAAELENTLRDSRREMDTRTEKLQQANVRYEVLQERFEDQSVTLTLTRESVGDGHERLLAAETMHAKHLAEATAKLERDIAVLQEQKLGLQASMEVLNESIKRQEASTLSVQEEYKDRLKQQDLTSAARLEAEEKRLKQLTDDLDDARARYKSLEDRNKGLEDDIRDLRSQLQVAQLPSPEMEAELRTLRSRITTLEAVEMKSTLRAKTIDARYRIGDLNDEEKAFINTLIQTSQAIHEQELVTNRNELRRRDNALKDMRAKVNLLESTLAKHLKAQKAQPAPASVDNGSMIDPGAWMSQSGHSSSPAHAPDIDGTASTNVDVTVSAKPTPAPNRADRRAPAGDSAPARVTPAKEAPASKAATHSRHITLLSANAARTESAKPNFSRLATDCSDEILDFDDENNDGQKSSSPSLGKRSKSDAPLEPVVEQGQGAPKPFKRLRASVRRTEVREYGLQTGAKKTLQPTGSKNRARKRR
ncbi:hypothetical protein C8Q80DRAFT_1153650 [Daedaleopsis nitida]|nr:hypothetical protein C8Q80DRAFT_1153650 [Daedaleopsis nitida]